MSTVAMTISRLMDGRGSGLVRKGQSRGLDEYLRDEGSITPLKAIGIMAHFPRKGKKGRRTESGVDFGASMPSGLTHQ
jgi:hypothetical protein